MTVIDLKPCPFCRGAAYLFVDDGVRVVCSKCRASSTTYKDTWEMSKPSVNAVRSAIDSWNRRNGE